MPTWQNVIPVTLAAVGTTTNTLAGVKISLEFVCVVVW